MTEYDESVLRGNKKLRVAQEPTTGELSVVTYGNTAKDGSGTYYIVLLDSDGKLAVRPLTSADVVTVQGITDALPAGDNRIGRIKITDDTTVVEVDATSKALKVLAQAVADGTYIGDIKFGESLPAGTNNVGDVDIASALPAGDNNIGNVDIVTLPTLPAGTNLIGRIDSLEPRERSNKTLMFEDNFETTKVNWTPASGDEFTHSTTTVFQGEKAAYLADADGATGSANISLQRLGSGLMSFEYWWFKDANFLGLRVDVEVYDGTNDHRYIVRFRETDNAWGYLNSAGGWTLISGGAEVINNNTWCWVRMVLDITNWEYEAFQTNYVNVGLTGIGVQASASAGEPRIDIILEGDFATGKGIYIDNVKVYKNEI